MRNDDEPEELATDILTGARDIAQFLGRKHRRAVYHLAETSRIPIFRLGSTLCARRSVLLAWIAAQEDRNWDPKG